MPFKERVYEDVLNLLQGERISGGIYREVFERRFWPELVVKVWIDREWQ